jgi:uncharacterized alkaline shock family protein YloU
MTTDCRYVVRVAPAVLAAMVSKAARQVPGVVRLADGGRPRRAWRGGAGPSATRDGVRVAVSDGRVKVEVRLVAARGQQLQDVGAAVQSAVAGTLEQLVGMDVEMVDVYVQDVD